MQAISVSMVKPGGSFVVLLLSFVHVKAPRVQLLATFDCPLECASLLCLSVLPGSLPYVSISLRV